MTGEHIDVKSRILLAAKKLFAEQGFDRTTNRQICEEANANIALISYHFGGMFYNISSSRRKSCHCYWSSNGDERGDGKGRYR